MGEKKVSVSRSKFKRRRFSIGTYEDEQTCAEKFCTRFVTKTCAIALYQKQQLSQSQERCKTNHIAKFMIFTEFCNIIFFTAFLTLT